MSGVLNYDTYKMVQCFCSFLTYLEFIFDQLRLLSLFGNLSWARVLSPAPGFPETNSWKWVLPTTSSHNVKFCVCWCGFTTEKSQFWRDIPSFSLSSCFLRSKVHFYLVLATYLDKFSPFWLHISFIYNSFNNESFIEKAGLKEKYLDAYTWKQH